jgi:hypothetical protein
MNGIYETTANARNIRYEQSIEFTIKPFDHQKEKYLHFFCIHEFTLVNDNLTTKTIDINTFNDITIPKETNRSLSENDRTQFTQVETKKQNGETFVYNWRDKHCSDNFGFDEYGRPYFATKGLRLSKKEKSITITYHITNVHKLKGSHNWYFQEISDGVTLKIDNQIPDSKGKFSLMIHHPNREDIEAQNRDSLDPNGKLIASIPNSYSSIQMNSVFLPYQGFELQWDLTQSSTADDSVPMQGELVAE